MRYELKKCRFLMVFGAFCLALAFPLLAVAQFARGAITGRVADPSGGSVAGAVVHVTNRATRATTVSRTNRQGYFSIPYLLPGTYSVSVRSPGFKQLVRRGVVVRLNSVVNLPLALELGTGVITVKVRAGAPLLDTASASIGQVETRRRITQFPLQGGNANQLVLLAPGVNNDTNIRVRKSSFNSASSEFSIDGSPQYSSEFLLDGIADSAPGGTNPLVAFQLPEFAVGQLKMETAPFDASVGHTAGGVLNVYTRGGTDKYHGELHEWIKNSALDAPTFFQNLSGQRPPVYQDNRFGASFGGPLTIPGIYNGRKQHTWFWFSWETNDWGTPVVNKNIGTVPTVAERKGDFSALLALGKQYQIFNPFTSVSSNGKVTRQPFAGNLIAGNFPVTASNPNGLDPLALALDKFYPLPNLPGTADGENNYIFNGTDTFKYTAYVARFDHQFSERNHAYLRLNFDHYHEIDPSFYNNLSGGLLLIRANKGLALDDVQVLSPSAVLDLRYGLTYENLPEQRLSAGMNLASLGFSPQLLSLLNPVTQTFPNMYFNTKADSKFCRGLCTGTYSGFSSFNGNGDGATAGMIHQLSGTLSLLHGNHSLHFGVDLRVYRSFASSGGCAVSPCYQFLPTYTNGPTSSSKAAPIGQEFASFLLGIPGTGDLESNPSSFATQDIYSGLFVQDDWRLTRKLTLNLGLRYEYESPETERYNRAIRGFNQIAANPIAAQAQSNYVASGDNTQAGLPAQLPVLGGLMFTSPSQRTLWASGAGNFMPRFGLAYELNRKTVLRAGYGMYYGGIGVNWSPAIQTGFTASNPIIASTDNGISYIASTANPFPNGIQKPQGAASGLTTALGQNLSVYPVNRKLPYDERWMFDIQRILPGQFTLDMAYVGNRGVHLPVDRNLNALPNQYLSTSYANDKATHSYLSQLFPDPFFGIVPGYPSQISRASLLVPYPEFGSIDEVQPIGFSSYNSLQLQLQKRFSHGFDLNFAYTWSKFINAASLLNAADASPFYELSALDRPQRIVLSGIYQLPFGRGRRFAGNSSSWLNAVIGGWQANAVLSYQSGPPLFFGNDLLTGAMSNIVLPAGQQNIGQWFNTADFVTNSKLQPQDQLIMPGNYLGYLGQVRGDGQEEWDVSAFKTFSLGERARLQFRAECYNCLNHPNLNTPSTKVTSGGFGTVTGQDGLSREFQFALAILF